MNLHRENSNIILPTDAHPVILYSDTGSVTRLESMDSVAVLPGSFNPLHVGHRQLAEVAATRLSLPVVFEISVSNVEKQSLDHRELLKRLQQFSGHSIVVTNASTFLRKSELFRSCPFVVGFDTAVRVLDRRFYGDSIQEMLQALGMFRERKHRFLVGGRISSTDGKSRFCCGEELTVPKGFGELFEVIPESEFRSDVSSTYLRMQNPNTLADRD